MVLLILILKYSVLNDEKIIKILIAESLPKKLNWCSKGWL